MAYTTAPLNAYEPIVDTQRRPSKTFIDWITSLTQDVDAAPARLDTVELTAQAASISTTPIGTPDADGLYRVTFYARITRAATVSSSLTVTLSWTHNGVTVTHSFSAVTGNTTTTFQSDSLLIRADAATPVSYATTYVSNGATTMQHSLDIVLEQVQA